MIKIVTFKTLLAGVVILSNSALAVEFGDYVRLSALDMDGEYFPSYYNAMQVNASEQGQLKTSYLCTDTTDRKVPGKIIDRRCWVEWKGDRYGNADFYVLKQDNYSWLPITNQNAAQDNSTIAAYGVTNGGWDEDNYVFHCKIITQSGNTTIETHGKYLPSREGCYYDYYGGKYAPISQPDYGLYEPFKDMYVLIKNNGSGTGGTGGSGAGTGNPGAGSQER
ncbi:DM9 repeat-containing protein [Aliiglaciecola sp. LCG003]|uniref:DM9 repeat-containing protein n=1 Tax=Aliiglaciecola sp. LCG003 TaxID=3053655 RepID=UPI00257445CD|nr:DM9 repeat-containing protein [Aliiglaciecola sp. LCG003]WJG09513.1 DUF3421 domain-containing protein [Aliiglaciecola sp. LCG003]